MTKSELHKKKIERLAKEQGITPTEYKRRCDENTAAHKGLTLSEYSKKRIEDAAKKKGMTVYEYKKECAEKTARNKGFRNRKDYDNAGKRAKVLHMTKEQYCRSLEKDADGFYNPVKLRNCLKEELMEKIVLKKTQLTAFAKECARASDCMQNAICFAGDVTKTQMCRLLLRGNNEDLLLEVSKRYAKYVNDACSFVVECGELQDFKLLIDLIVGTCEDNNWFQED